jgi:DNA-binding protein Fis
LVGMSLAEVERLLIEATIQACGASLPRGALVLGVSPSTLYRKRAGWSDL